ALYCSMVDPRVGRKMEGVSPDEIEQGYSIAPSVRVYLQKLCRADIRIIERVDDKPGEEKYRLAQELFCEVLRPMSEQIPDEIYRLQWSFTEQFERWQQGQNKWRNLLRRKQLKNALIWQPFLLRSDDYPERQDFLKKSRWRIRFIILALIFS